MGKAKKLKQLRKEEEERRRQEEKKRIRRKFIIAAITIATIAATVGLVFLVDYMKKREEESPPPVEEVSQELDASVPTVPDEIGMPNVTGAVAMAKPSDPQTQQPLPDSASNEFYILKQDAEWLDGDFTVFGEVIEGMEVVNSLTVEDALDMSQVRETESGGEAVKDWVLETSKGTIVVRLYESEAPLTTQHIIALVERGFYNDLMWYRVEDWVVQSGSHYRSLQSSSTSPVSAGEAVPVGGQ